MIGKGHDMPQGHYVPQGHDINEWESMVKKK
jgi:hypothetical protein